MRFVPTRVHAVIDYLWGALLLAMPFLAGFADDPAARSVAMVFGAGAIGYSLVTDYELGLLRLVPMSLHLVLDVVAGAILAASPWLFGFAGRVFWPHLLFGLFAVAAGLVTFKRPATPV
jgi:hypothetical protein